MRRQLYVEIVVDPVCLFNAGWWRWQARIGGWVVASGHETAEELAEAEAARAAEEYLGAALRAPAGTGP